MIPDAAIEAAAEAMAVRDGLDRLYATAYLAPARAAVEAAMPAIREALAQQIEAAHDMAVAERRSVSDPNAYARMTAYDRAVRIVRGGTP